MIGLRVLVIDDDPAIVKMLTLMLGTRVDRVVAVSSGEEALQRLRVDQFDVVMSDLGLGQGINSLELGTLMRRDWPRVRFVQLTKPFRSADIRRSIAA
jgi:CheY-like chemotaxis protein